MRPILSQNSPFLALLHPLLTLGAAQDRGYHALRASSERNQRVLHRLLHSWEEALSRSAAPIFAAAADSIGRVAPAAPPAPKADAVADAAALEEARRVKEEATAAAAAAAEEAEQAAEAAEAAAIAAESAGWAGHASALCADAASDAASLSCLGVASGTGASSLSRLAPLCARLSGVLGAALMGGYALRLAGSRDLEDAASAIASRAAALRIDAAATKPVKKKALTDLLKALSERGVSLRRSGVPPSQRDSASWFTLPPVDAGPALAPPGAPWDSAPALALWAKSDGYYWRNMARLQALWMVNAGMFHADVSPREAEAARFSVEHLLHLQRVQRAALREAAASADALAEASSLAQALRCGGALPPSTACRAWLWRAKGAMDCACSVADEALLLLKALRCVEGAPQQAGCLPAALAAVAGAASALCEAKAGLLDVHLLPSRAAAARGAPFADAQHHPQLVTPAMARDLAAALAVAPAQLAALRCAGDDDGGGLPGWAQLLAQLRALDELAHQFAADAAGWAPAAALEEGAAAPPAFVVDAEAVLSEVLLWAQNVHAAAAAAAAAESQGDEPQPDAAGESVGARGAWLEGLLGAGRSTRIAAAVHSLAARLAQLSDDAAPGAAAAAQVLGALAPLLQLQLSASARLAFDYLALHKATAKLGGTLSSVFAALARDGFCTPPGQQAEGEGGENGKLLDDQGGTGMGAGEGKKDVSDEIEDEAQILGMEDLQKEEGAPEPQPDDTDKGIEMAGDFAGDMHELEHDAPDDGEEPPEETEADQLDKEVRGLQCSLARCAARLSLLSHALRAPRRYCPDEALDHYVKPLKRILMAESKGLSCTARASAQRAGSSAVAVAVAHPTHPCCADGRWRRWRGGG